VTDDATRALVRNLFASYARGGGLGCRLLA